MHDEDKAEKIFTWTLAISVLFVPAFLLVGVAVVGISDLLS